MNKKLVDAADKYSDPTRLCKSGAAIRQLKADVKAMNVVVGAKSAVLMGKQLGRQQAGEETKVQPCRITSNYLTGLRCSRPSRVSIFFPCG